MIGQINAADHLTLERGEIVLTLAVMSPDSTHGVRFLGVGPWQLGVLSLSSYR
jgi:hypothetical protein